MQQNNHHIENNLAKIELEAEADLSQMDNHWASMKNVLALQKPTMTTAKKWLWASLPIWVIILLVLLFANKFSSKTNIAVEENKSAVDGKKVLPDSTSFQKSTIAINQYNLINASSTTQINKNNQIPNISFPKKIIPALLIPKTGNTGNSSIINDADAIDTSNANILSVADSIKINNELERIQKVQMLYDFIAKIKKKGELFTINNLRDTTIRAAEGTVFFIPMNCFDTKDSVVFEVKEYYKYSDMVANGLTTMADDKQLISGGMLSLSASVKGKEISLNPTKEIRVFIPNLTAKDSMEIFEGKKKETQDFNLQKNTVIAKNNINWQLTKVSIDSPVLRMFIRAIDLKDDEIEYTTTYNRNKNKAVFRRAITSSYSKSELLVMLRKKYGDYYDKIRIHNLWKRDLLFRVKEIPNEYIDFAPYDSWGVGDTALLSPSTVRIYRLEPIDTVYKVWGWITKGYVTTNRPLFSPNVLSMIGEKYSIGIGKLGWINCDRFYNYKGKKSNINVALKDSAHLFVTYMVFEKLKILVQGYENGKTAVFPNIPMGEPVRIISIGVKNGKIVTAMKSMITSNSFVTDLPFEQASSLEFKETLKTLDKPSNE
jgi:hypothetical protein